MDKCTLHTKRVDVGYVFIEVQSVLKLDQDPFKHLWVKSLSIFTPDEQGTQTWKPTYNPFSKL
jgi:hypothetical protein